MDPQTLTDWHLDAQDRPGDIIVVRIVGTDAHGWGVVTAPLVERLPSRRVKTADGRIWVLGKRNAV